MNPTLLLQREGAVASIVFNRPEALNAINIAMAEAFRDAIRTVAGDESIRLLVLRGEGRSFMAGGDIAEMSVNPTATAQRIIAPVHEGIELMAKLRIPVLAAVHGAVAGAGMSIALAADLALAADDANFQMAYTRLGASPDASGSWHLARLVGLRKAMEITLLSDRIDAPEALRLGLVNWVVARPDFDTRLQALCARLVEAAVAAQGRSKALLRDALLRSLPEQLEAERLAFLEGAQGSEFREGVDAFLNKRKPDFRSARLHDSSCGAQQDRMSAA